MPRSGFRAWAPPAVAAWAPAAVAAALTALALSPVLGNGFVNFDDFEMFHQNPGYQGLGWGNVRWALTTFHFGHYGPLSWLSYSVDHALWGLEPFGYHLTSLALHVVNTLLVYGIALRLLAVAARGVDDGPVRLGAVVAALAYGLHPLRVEPVAWASIRGTLLGALFLFLTVRLYLEGVARAGDGPLPVGWRRGVALGFALSLLSRTTGLTLPAVLVLLDVYPLRRLPVAPWRWLAPPYRARLTEKVPLAVLGLLAVPLSIAARLVTVGEETERHGLASGLARAAYGAALYLAKTVVPIGLSPFYERADAIDPGRTPYLTALAVVVVLTAALSLLAVRWPAALVAWTTFGVLILPMSGLLPVGNLPLAGDRYTYVACAGWFVLLGGGVAAMARAARAGRVGPALTTTAAVALAALLAVWGGLAWRQAGVWRDSRSLWTQAVRAVPFSGVARGNLGTALDEAGEADRAFREYVVAVGLRPDLGRAWANLGRQLYRRGDPAAARQVYERSIALAPGRAEGYLGLGLALAAEGRGDEAAGQYRLALARDPRSSAAHFNLAEVLRRQGRTEEAVKHLETAIREKPDFTEARQALDAVRNGRALRP